MRRPCIATTLMTGALVLGLMTLSLAQTEIVPVSRGVVATITAINAKTGMVTLTTENGEVFEVWKGWRWKVGNKVECDRIEEPPHPRLQDCKPWQ